MKARLLGEAMFAKREVSVCPYTPQLFILVQLLRNRNCNVIYDENQQLSLG